MNYQEFAKRVKTKYPEYTDMDDLSLAKAMVAKFPEDYKDITFEAAPVEQPRGVSSSSGDMPSASSSAPRVEKEKISPQAREEATGFWKSQLFPESAEAFVRGDNTLDRALAGVSDVATLPGRFYIGSTDNMGYTPDEAEGWRQRIASDRTLLPLAGLGAVGLPVKAGVVAGATRLGAPGRVAATVLTGAAEGAGGSVASDVVGGRDVSPLGAALGAVTGGVLSAPGAALRQARVGHIEDPEVANLAYRAAMGKGAVGAKGLDEGSEKILRAAKDVDLPRPEVLAKAQDQIGDALTAAENRAKDLRKSNRITAETFSKGTEARKAVIDNLMAEGTWLTPEALMREARRVRQADPDLAVSLEKIAASRLWDATHGRALNAAFDMAPSTPSQPLTKAEIANLVRSPYSGMGPKGMGAMAGDIVDRYKGSLARTAELPNAELLRGAQKSGAAASELVKGLPGGKAVTVGHILEGYLPLPPGTGGAATNDLLPYRDRLEEMGLPAPR